MGRVGPDWRGGEGTRATNKYLYFFKAGDIPKWLDVGADSTGLSFSPFCSHNQKCPSLTPSIFSPF